MYELKKKGKTFLRVNLLGTGPSSYEKRIYRAAVSQRLRHTGLQDQPPLRFVRLKQLTVAHASAQCRWTNTQGVTGRRFCVSFSINKVQQNTEHNSEWSGLFTVVERHDAYIMTRT